MPSSRRTPRSALGPALVTVLALVALSVAAPVLAGRSPAAAQPATTEGTTPVATLPAPSPSGPSGSPIALVARGAPDLNAPVPVRVQGFWVDGGTPDRPVVVVRFAEPFPVPTTPWRVSVSAGDPSGERVRSSLVSVGTAGVSGRAERGDGTLWDDLGEVGVSAPGDGSVRLEVPVAGLPAGSVVWVEAEATEGGRIVTGSTSWFALQDVLGTRSGPSLGVADVATTDGRSGAPVVLPGAGPTVRAVSRALELTTTEPVPTEVDGVPVIDVVDTVEIARPAADAADPAALGRTDLVLVDRRTGTIQLLPEGGTPVDGVAGTTPWLATGLSPTAPGAPATVTFDLEQLDLALGGPVLDRATTRVGVTRAVTLRDGRVLRAPGVLGTIEWFDDVGFGATPAPAATPAAEEAGLPAGLLVAGVVVVLAVVAVVVVLVRRRRRRAGAPVDRDAQPAAEAPPVTAPPAAGSGAEPGAVDRDATPAPSVAPAAEAAPPVGPTPADEVTSTASAAPPPTPVAAPSIAAPTASDGSPPVDAPRDGREGRGEGEELAGAVAARPEEGEPPGADQARHDREAPTDRKVEVRPDPADPAVASTPLPVEPVARPRRPRRAPAAAPAGDPLAAFLAEVDELSARVDRLAERQGAAPGTVAAADDDAPDPSEGPESPGGAAGSVRP